MQTPSWCWAGTESCHSQSATLSRRETTNPLHWTLLAVLFGYYVFCFDTSRYIYEMPIHVSWWKEKEGNYSGEELKKIAQHEGYTTVTAITHELGPSTQISWPSYSIRRECVTQWNCQHEVNPLLASRKELDQLLTGKKSLSCGWKVSYRSAYHSACWWPRLREELFPACQKHAGDPTYARMLVESHGWSQCITGIIHFLTWRSEVKQQVPRAKVPKPQLRTRCTGQLWVRNMQTQNLILMKWACVLEGHDEAHTHSPRV